MRRSATRRARSRQQHPVGEHAEAALAQHAHTAGRELERELVASDDQVVVAERLPFLESHEGAQSRIRAPPSPGRAATSIRRTPASLRTPGELALGRSCGRRFMPSTPPRAARRTRALRAVSSEAPAACARATSSRTAPPRSGHALVDRRVQRFALHREPGEQRGMAKLLAPQLRRPVRSARRSSSSSSERTTRWRSLGSIASAAHARGQARVQRG